MKIIILIGILICLVLLNGCKNQSMEYFDKLAEEYSEWISCAEIAKLDYNIENPYCELDYPGDNTNFCFCYEQPDNPCIKWDIRNNSKRCIEYKYTYEEMDEFKYNNWISFEKLGEIK